MARKFAVHLEDDFDSPYPRTRLEIFLMLARAIRDVLPELIAANRNKWHEVVRVMAETIEEQLPRMTVAADVAKIWTQFIGNATVADLGPKVRAILDRVESTLVPTEGANEDLKYLAEANNSAVDWLQKLGIARKLAALTNVKPVSVRVYLDPEAREYCASTNRLIGEIGWKLQLKLHAFYGALIPDVILEHEYLSHLVPLNGALSKAVQEIWLTAGLTHAHRNAKADRSLKVIRTFLWNNFREKLADHFEGGEAVVYGPEELDRVSDSIVFDTPGIYWRLSEAILADDREENGSGMVDEILELMAEMDDEPLKAVLSSDWKTLDDLLGRLRDVK